MSFKPHARSLGKPFKEALNELLRTGLLAAASRPTSRRFRIKPFHMGYRPELNYDDAESLLESAGGSASPVTILHVNILLYATFPKNWIDIDKARLQRRRNRVAERLCNDTVSGCYIYLKADQRGERPPQTVRPFPVLPDFLIRLRGNVVTCRLTLAPFDVSQPELLLEYAELGPVSVG